jgi:hypothetical protein
VPCCPPDNVDGVTSMMLNGPGASQINCAAASAVPRKCVELGRGCHVNRHGRHPPGVPSLGRSGCDQAEERSNLPLSDSMRTYRPKHSAHGNLYWRFAMWLLLSSRIPRVTHRSIGRHRLLDDDSAVPRRAFEGTPRATPLSSLPDPWLSPRQDSVWHLGEGRVMPVWSGPRHDGRA